MNTESTDGDLVAATLDAIRQELALLNVRVLALEAASAKAAIGVAPAPPVAAPLPAPPAAALSEELIVVIGAAVAAFLGKKAHVRAVRLIGTAAWAQQGRVTIQASHVLPSAHGRSQA
jgi:methylmalonyl-CoA carboxyltransferase large subunit